MERGSQILRAIDKTIGIPLVFFIGKLKGQKRACPKNVRTLGVLATPAIGDVIVLSPILKKIRQELGFKIHLYLGNANRELVELLDCADSYSILPMTKPWLAVNEIQKKEFDVWIDTGQWARIGAIYSTAAKANYKVGFQTPGQARHFVYDEVALHSNMRHEIENFRELFKWTGLCFTESPVIPHSIKKVANRIVMHAFPGGSGAHLKSWPTQYWTALINRELRAGREIYLTGAKENRAEALAIAASFPGVEKLHVVAGEYSLKETLELIASAEHVVTVNTGIMHLAAALGTRLTALHGPTSVKRWGPLSKNATAIQSPRKCSPCLNLGFDYGCPVNHCMQEITPESVKI